MEKINLPYLCTVIGNLSGVPIRLYEKEKLVFYHALVRLPKDPIVIYKQEIWQIQKSVGYFVTQNFNYYGIVNSGDQKVVIGPTRQTESTTQELRELAFRADVGAEEVDDFVGAMKSIVRMPLVSIMQMLCTINHVLNGEMLSLQDIAIYDTQSAALHTEPQEEEEKTGINQNVHNTFELEQAIMRIVQKGDTQHLPNIDTKKQKKE